AADHELRVAAHPMHPVDRTPNLLDASPDRTRLDAEPAVRADVRDLQAGRAQQAQRALGSIRVELRAGEADRAEVESLEIVDVVLARPPPEDVGADREALEGAETGARSRS